jgi:hydroxymethylglutaryl-CoA lyase
MLLGSLLSKISPEVVAVHFHDTYGRGVENVLTSLNFGIRTFDASVGGIGGCPFAPGATGNVATEAVVRALQEKGALNQVRPGRLAEARRLLDPFLTEERRSLPKAGSAACAGCEFYNGDTCCGRKDPILGSAHVGSVHRP